MDFSKFEHISFSTKRGFDSAIKNIFREIGGVIVVNPNALDHLKGWKDVKAAYTEAKTNVDGVDGFYGDTPIVVQGDSGMNLVLVPIKHEIYVRLSKHKA